MSYDGLFTGVVAHQLDCLADGRAKIEKIHQPEPDILVVQINTKQGRKKLLLSAQSAGAACYLTERTFDNPLQAPPFCMLLRKHILGGRITGVRQPDTERIIEFSIDTVNEMGYTYTKKLVAELMGKHSNIVLIDIESNKIIDCIKHISIDVNRYRQLLPGIPYTPPPSQNKINAWESTVEDIQNRLSLYEKPEARTFMEVVAGIGPTMAEEIWQSGSVDTAIKRFLLIRDTLYYHKQIQPEVYVNESGEPIDVHVYPLSHVFSSNRTIAFNQIGEALDFFYANRIQSNRLLQRGAALMRHVQTIEDKLLLKKQRLSEELARAENSEPVRLRAELLTANLHRINRGSLQAEVVNYYDGQTMEIELDPRYSPAQNAQNLYKQYQKAKTAAIEKRIQLDETDRELAYLESVMAAASLAVDDETLENIRMELAESGYVRMRKSVKRKRTRPKPVQHKTSGGLTFLIGRNNVENDYITFSLAAKADLWFHAKDIPGSHVVLKLEGREPASNDILEAASMAAQHSKAHQSQNVPVDYTSVRHVRKPSGAKPGMVVYDSQKTVYVNPGSEFAKNS